MKDKKKVLYEYESGYRKSAPGNEKATIHIVNRMKDAGWDSRRLDRKPIPHVEPTLRLPTFTSTGEVLIVVAQE
jgi:hypothetical protein